MRPQAAVHSSLIPGVSVAAGQPAESSTDIQTNAKYVVTDRTRDSWAGVHVEILKISLKLLL